MDRQDLVKELNYLIWKEIERKMGVPVSYVLLTYKNLPHSNAYTKSKNPEYIDVKIYKHTLSQWLKTVEDWIFSKLVELEPEIRFTESSNIM